VYYKIHKLEYLGVCHGDGGADRIFEIISNDKERVIIERLKGII
jgi:hypothetical protein